MALLKTIAELKAMIPRLSNLSNTGNMPNMDKAGKRFVLPIVGATLYNAIDTRYNLVNPDPVLSDDEKNLIAAMQLPIAAFGILSDLPFLQTVITDSGIRTPQTSTMQSAHKWEFNNLRNALYEYANDGIELLLEYLYQTINSWPQWTGSDEFKAIDNMLIKTGVDFNKQYKLLQPYRTFWELRPMMEDVEEMYLSSKLGRDLLQWVKDQDTIIINVGTGQLDVKKQLKKAVAFLTIKQATEHRAANFSNEGFTIVSLKGDPDNSDNAGRESASVTQLKLIQDTCLREGQNYLHKAANYLVGIANGQFNTDFGDEFTTAFSSSPLFVAPGTAKSTDPNACLTGIVML